MKEGWKMVKLGEIVKLIADGDWIESKDQSHEGIRLIQTGNIGVGFFKDKSDSCRYISESTFNKLKCTEIFEGDCLVSRLPDPVGRACIIPCTNTRMITAVDCSILRFDNSVLPGWFVFYSQSKEYFNKVDKESTGSTRKRISRKNLSQIEIPLPPLEEQHRIISILDASFEKIDALKKNAEENLKNAKALFQQVLAQELQPKEGWVEKKLGEIGVIFSGYAFKSSLFKDNGKYQVIRIGNIKQNNLRLDESPIFTDDVDSNVIAKSLLQRGDLVVTQTGTRHKRDYGFMAMVSIDNLLLNQRNACVRISNAELAKFVLYYSYTNLYKDDFFANEGGTVGQGNVGINALKEMMISFPADIVEQHRIVSTLDTLSEKCRRLEQVAQQTIRECDALKQSILRQAFSGEL